MKDWEKYYATKSSDGAISGRKPSAFEYAIIKLVDNAMPACVLLLIFVFAGLGAFFRWRLPQPETAVWFFDMAKLCIGVFLGALAQKARRS